MSATGHMHLDAESEARGLAEAAGRLAEAPPQEILRWAVERYRPSISLACSFGMQSVVILDMLHELELLGSVEVFYLDTGVLFPQTHQTRLRAQERYGFLAVRLAADLSWEAQQEKYGGHLYERGVEGVNECCRIRKVEPQRKYMAGRNAWITGLRRAQDRQRGTLPIVQWDAVNGAAKINPLAQWQEEEIWRYIKSHDVPFNPLYDQGYPSIGCNTPVCTRPVALGEDPRSGRWAGLGKTECGIHLDGQSIKSLDSSGL